MIKFKRPKTWLGRTFRKVGKVFSNIISYTITIGLVIILLGIPISVIAILISILIGNTPLWLILASIALSGGSLWAWKSWRKANKRPITSS